MTGPLQTDPVEEREEAAEPASRASFLRRGATGGLVLAVGGAALAAAACGSDSSSASSTAAATTASGTGTSGAGMTGDADIAKLAATAELLAIDFYGKAIKTGFFRADVLAYMNAARQNEQDHYDALAKVLGSAAPKDVTFTYPDGTFASAGSIATTGSALETAFVGAYMGAISSLKDPKLKVVAAQIGANEAQHLTTLKSLGANKKLVPNPSLPKMLTAAQATAAVKPFLA
jgi:rubrerythrin